MDFKTINFWPKKFENSKFLQQQGQQKLQQWKKNYFNQNLISLSKKINQRSCPSAEPAKSHKKLKKKKSSAIQMRVNEMQKQKQNPQHKFTQHFKIQHKDSDWDLFILDGINSNKIRV